MEALILPPSPSTSDAHTYSTRNTICFHFSIAAAKAPHVGPSMNLNHIPLNPFFVFQGNAAQDSSKPPPDKECYMKMPVWREFAKRDIGGVYLCNWTLIG